MKPVYLLLSVLFFSQLTIAQNPDCKVLPDSLKGTYEGECKNGKASGKGKAVGMHTYDGDFKNGLPDGKGKYTWKNGDYFYGEWKKGSKDGKGQLHSWVDGQETLLTGYWKNDKYRGEYEYPYVIQNATSEIGRVQVSKMANTGNTISVTVENLLNGGSIASSTQLKTLTVMTSNQITRGSYMSKSSNALTNKEITIFRGVIFPFRAAFTFGNATLEIEFFEEGAWDVSVPINK